MDTEVKEKKDVVPPAYREKYKATGGTCGDFIAEGLSKVSKDGGLDSVKTENGIDASRWGTFNPGMQRMNLANTLRAQFLNGATIKILGKEYNALHQLEDFNGDYKAPGQLSKIADYLGLQQTDRVFMSLSKLIFPPEKKGPTAEERAAAKAETAKVKEAEKVAKSEAAAKAKQEKADKAAADKATKTEASAKAKQEKADKAAAAKAAKAEKPAG